MALRDAIRATALGTAGLLLAACSAPVAPGPVAAPPAPPAACLLDAAALSAATGVTWTVDDATASDLRCVYDPADADAGVFLAVDVTEDGPALDVVAQVCTEGSRTPAGDGFGCRLATGGVFAARTGRGRLITAAAARIPAGTSAKRLDAALAAQLR